VEFSVVVIEQQTFTFSLGNPRSLHESQSDIVVLWLHLISGTSLTSVLNLRLNSHVFNGFPWPLTANARRDNDHICRWMISALSKLIHHIQFVIVWCCLYLYHQCLSCKKSASIYSFTPGKVENVPSNYKNWDIYIYIFLILFHTAVILMEYKQIRSVFPPKFLKP
jgi:hypothetical protein